MTLPSVFFSLSPSRARAPMSRAPGRACDHGTTRAQCCPEFNCFFFISVIASQTRLSGQQLQPDNAEGLRGSKGWCNAHLWRSKSALQLFLCSSPLSFFLLFVTLENKVVNSSVATSLSSVPAVTRHVGERRGSLFRESAGNKAQEREGGGCGGPFCQPH